MAWTTPRTWVATEVVTAAIMNTHVRDNLDYLKASPALTSPTFAGDIGLAATKKLYFDGVAMTGDTYIVESAGNTLSLYSGGVESKLTSGVLTVPGVNSSHTFGTASTSYASVKVTNTGGNIYLGIDNSTAGYFQTGGNYAGQLFFDGSAGLSIAAIHASGDIRGYAGGTTQKFAIKASDGHTYTDNGSVYNLSDLRYKSFVAPFTRGLAEILKLIPAMYQHHAATGAPEAAAPFVSLGAQDVEPIIPEAVSLGSDGKYGLGTSPLLYASINAIKELHGGWQQHDAELAALRARVAELEAKIALLSHN